jgi:hypothetical protein
LELEKEFQAGRALEPVLLDYQNDPGRRTELLKQAPASKWETAWARYELLRFARLCHFLRVRPADASIGYSIRIYRLSADEVAGAVGGSARDWESLIERTVAARP